MDSLRLPKSLATLLGHAIDYAGLFPPAALSLDDVVRNYAGYRASPEQWALGRLIVPANRLPEFTAALAKGNIAPAGWRVSATLGSDLVAEGRLVSEAARDLAAAGVVIDAVEAKVGDVAAVETLARWAGPTVTWYAEVGLQVESGAVLDAIAGSGGSAKVRMGGVTPEIFPDPEAVAAMVAAVIARGLTFKATAGLHHPLRGLYPLTYQPDSESAPMFGYLNLLLATMLTQLGRPAGEVREGLLESAASELHADDGGLRWRHYRLTGLDDCRRAFHGFGSCSFREPLDELENALTP